MKYRWDFNVRFKEEVKSLPFTMQFYFLSFLNEAIHDFTIIEQRT